MLDGHAPELAYKKRRGLCGTVIDRKIWDSQKQPVEPHRRDSEQNVADDPRADLLRPPAL